MKRFLCTICGRIKRVRKYPSDISHVNSDNVLERTGTCARHYAEPDTYVPVKAKVSDLTSLLNSRTPRSNKQQQNKKRA
jgi:hypothetical protein